MTLKELFSVQTGTNEIISLRIELQDLEDFNPYKGNVITDMPRGGGSKELGQWYSEEKERIEKKIEIRSKQLQKDRENVEKFINKAPLPERDIIRYKVINNMSWSKIGKRVGYSRQSVTRKFYDYIKSLAF